MTVNTSHPQDVSVSINKYFNLKFKPYNILGGTYCECAKNHKLTMFRKKNTNISAMSMNRDNFIAKKQIIILYLHKLMKLSELKCLLNRSNSRVL